jgi:hypothetical protein
LGASGRARPAEHLIFSWVGTELTTSPAKHKPKQPSANMIPAATVLSLLLCLLPVSSLVGSYCNDDGTTNVAAQGDFQYNSIAFGKKFRSNCTCNNNTLQCQNQCETCFRGVCGVLETSQDERRQSEASTTVVPVANYSLCMTYTGGRAPLGGKTCFTYDAAAKNTTYPDGSKICEMSYNGESCTWCKMYDGGCIRANCTNILADARVNTCWTDAWQGIEQQFRVAALVNNITAVQETRLGQCGFSDLDSIDFGDDIEPMEPLRIDPPADDGSAPSNDRADEQDDETDSSSDPSLESSQGQTIVWSWTIPAGLMLLLLF